jgi:Flp pilus assembly protein TadG
MILTRLRRGRSGQAIVIMALAMVAICGMLALAIDTGRLYFQRRLMQDAVDAGSLAGAQSLVGTVSNPIGQPNYALYYALDDTFSVFNQNPANNDPTSSFYTSPVNNTVTDTEGGYTVTAVAPTGYNNKQVQVTVSYNAIATFVQVLGFNSIGIVATATAEAGTNAKTYAIFAYGGIGTGNTINIQGAGYGQVDNGQDGTDACSATPSGETISNAKIHVPTGYPGVININGNIYINQANDNQHMAKYWVTQPPFAAGQDPEPNYLIPDTSQIPSPHARAKQQNVPSGSSFTANGVTVYNNTSSARDIVIYYPGKYSGNGNNIQIPNNASGDSSAGLYVFANGLYLFTGGSNLVIKGGNVSNTNTGLPHYVGGVGASNLPPAADGTDGVEFIFDNGSYFTADNSLSANAGSAFFVAPSYVPTGSTHVAFYIAQTNSYANPWSETVNAQSSNVPRFQIWGSVFDSSANGGTQGGTGMTLTGVELGPHNMSPSDDANPGGPGSAGQYAVTGEFIGFTLTIDDGAVQGNASGGPASCPAGITAGHPALLVQYNKNFAPAPGVNSFLVK